MCNYGGRLANVHLKRFIWGYCFWRGQTLGRGYCFLGETLGNCIPRDIYIWEGGGETLGKCVNCHMFLLYQ